jgi:multisubunit Na+/H+ antiporter MnhF subunit
MNAFATAATILIVLLVPLGVVTIRRRPLDGLVALILSSAIVVVTLLCLAEALHRSTYYATAVIAAVSGLIGSLVFARFLGRWV